MPKKLRPLPRKRRRRGELPESLQSLKFVELRLRIRRGEATPLADLCKRIERERSAIVNLAEALQEAGIKPSSGRWFDDRDAP
jgi:hypothetical protein